MSYKTIDEWDESPVSDNDFKAECDAFLKSKQEKATEEMKQKLKKEKEAELAEIARECQNEKHYSDALVGGI
jgi:hypothetical protein